MRVLPDSRRMLGRRSIPRSTAGIGLVELMVVVLIISLIMALAMPSYQRVQRRARAAALVNNFRVFASIFQAHAHESGGWPPEKAAGFVPDSMVTAELKTDDWLRPTSIGAHWDWENNQVHSGGTSPGGRWRAALAIADTAGSPLIIDSDLYLLMDQSFDDGILSEGNFRLGSGNCPIFILEL